MISHEGREDVVRALRDASLRQQGDGGPALEGVDRKRAGIWVSFPVI